MTFYEKVRSLCMKNGFAISYIGDKIAGAPANKASISAWKKGVIPRSGALKAIADYFGVTVTSLTNDELDIEYTDKKKQGLSYIAVPVSDFATVPLLSSVRAGFGAEIVESFGEIRRIPSEFLHGYSEKEIFLLRVNGDSMSPRILDEDIVVVHRCSSVDSGNIAIVLYDDNEATIKRVRYVNGQDWLDLVPMNEEYKTVHIEGEALEHCRVLGKVISLLRETI